MKMADTRGTMYTGRQGKNWKRSELPFCEQRYVAGIVASKSKVAERGTDDRDRMRGFPWGPSSLGELFARETQSSGPN
jgi:hypothetical protein